MSPIAQKASGLGAIIGFALTFVLGSPVSGEGAMSLVLHSVLAGMIFGALGFVMGDLFHRFISEKLTMRIDAIILEKEMKRQEKLRRAQEQLEKLKAAGMTPPDVEFRSDMNIESTVVGEESPAGI